MSERARGSSAESGGGRRRRFTVDALFADHRPQAVGVSDLPTAKEIRLDRIEPDPEQPRRTFDAEKLEELAASIQHEGILQPIVVRYDEARDVYVVVHGERRWRAARLAGLDRLPALVREVPADRRLIQQLMENIVRDDLNAVDRAAALRGLKAQLGDVPWEQVADAVGIRRSRLFQLLGTEKLPTAAQDDIRAGRLTERQSRALQGLGPGQQEALRTAILADDLPADEATRLARELRVAAPPDDPVQAAVVLAGLRSAPLPSSAPAPPATKARVIGLGPDDSAAALLAAIAAAVGGGRIERQELSRLADQSGALPYDPERLQAEVRRLAQSLARVPSLHLAPGTPAHTSLSALCDVLEALLGER